MKQILTVEETEAEQSLDSTFRIKTLQGIKTSAALYRTLYKAVKALSEKRDTWHDRVKEAVRRLGVPVLKQSDKVKISLREKKNKNAWAIFKAKAKDNQALKAIEDNVEALFKSRWNILMEMSQNTPALMQIIDEVQREAQSTVQTVVITDN